MFPGIEEIIRCVIEHNPIYDSEMTDDERYDKVMDLLFGPPTNSAANVGHPERKHKISSGYDGIFFPMAEEILTAREKGVELEMLGLAKRNLWRTSYTGTEYNAAKSIADKYKTVADMYESWEKIYAFKQLQEFSDRAVDVQDRADAQHFMLADEIMSFLESKGWPR